MKLYPLLFAFALSVLLTACGGGGNVKPDSQAPAAQPETAAKPATPPKRGGGYYLDDGPGDNPPPDIDSIPDAVPRPEPLLPRANRPYSALGIRYTPQTEYVPYKERGIASWYGKRYHGQKSSSGEIYDMYSMSGAHTILPIPSYARVTNVENGRSVIVRINDRGPFHNDRIIDLSYAAAYKLRLLEKGSGMVEVEAIDTRDPNQKRAKDLTLSIPSPPPPPVYVDIPHGDVELAASASGKTNPAAAAGAKNSDNGEFASKPNTASGDYVQVGVFKQKSNAEGIRARLIQKHYTENVPIESWYNGGTYRVRLGPYPSRQDAERAAASIKQALGANAIVIHQQ